jgi:16S rRNA (guanine1207-N2)-methyltransferase
MDLPGLRDPWISYPGVFAHGHLDPGTSLLLEALPALPEGAHILDYGCGSGVVGRVARERGRAVTLDLLDVDSVALEATRENVPGGRLLLGDGLPEREAGVWDAVVTNPPFHRGKAEDPGMIVGLVRGTGRVLTPGGSLVLVTHRRLRLEDELRRAFRRVEILAERGTFRVWRGVAPTRAGATRAS